MDTIKHLNIEFTDYCNQACQYCFNSCNSKGEHSPFEMEKWFSVFRELMKKGLESIHVTGGEPFCNPNIIDFIKLISDLGLQISVLSNGYKVTWYCEHDYEIIRKLSKAQISLDSLDVEFLTKIRGAENALNDALTAIFSLKSLGVPVEISTVNVGFPEHINRILEFSEIIECDVVIRELEEKGRARNIFGSIAEYSSLNSKIKNDSNFYLPSERSKGVEIGYWTVSSNGDFLPYPYKDKNKVYKNLSDVA